MKKIAIVSPVFFPYRAGMARVPEVDAELLVSAGYEVVVHTPRYRRQARSEVRGGYRVVRHTPVLTLGNAAVVPQLLFDGQDADVVFLHYPFFGGAEWVALGRALRRRARMVLMFHMDAVASGLKGWVFRVYRWLMQWFVLWMSDRVVVTTMDYARESSVGGFVAAHPKKVEEMVLSVNTDVFCPGEVSTGLRARYGIATDERVIMSLGSLDEAHRFRGIDVLIKGFAEYVRRGGVGKLLICGSGELLEEYCAVARDAGVGERVVFTGFVADAELIAHYRLANVLVLASVSSAEAFGIVPVEAMACGVPVIASDLAGVRTVVGEVGVLFAPGDVQGLGLALGKVFSDEVARKAMGVAARKRVVEKYSNTARRAALVKIVESI